MWSKWLQGYHFEALPLKPTATSLVGDQQVVPRETQSPPLAVHIWVQLEQSQGGAQSKEECAFQNSFFRAQFHFWQVSRWLWLREFEKDFKVFWRFTRQNIKYIISKRTTRWEKKTKFFFPWVAFLIKLSVCFFVCVFFFGCRALGWGGGNKKINQNILNSHHCATFSKAWSGGRLLRQISTCAD